MSTYLTRRKEGERRGERESKGERETIESGVEIGQEGCFFFFWGGREQTTIKFGGERRDLNWK